MMENAQYDWKNLSATVTVEHGPRVYGYFHRNGKTFIRRYRHVLKNGKGKSSLDLFIEKTEDLSRLAESQLGISIFYK